MSDKAQKIGRRWWNAKAIIDGACNPRAICHSIIDGCNEVLNVENGDPRKDEALRIMTYQLQYLMGTGSGVAGYQNPRGEDLFSSDYKKVCEMAEAYDQQEEKARFEARCVRDSQTEKLATHGLTSMKELADEAAKRG